MSATSQAAGAPEQPTAQAAAQPKRPRSSPFTNLRLHLANIYRLMIKELRGIRSDPNRPDDEEYIVRLVGQVVHVSLETARIVSALPERYMGTFESILFTVVL